MPRHEPASYWRWPRLEMLGLQTTSCHDAFCFSSKQATILAPKRNNHASACYPKEFPASCFSAQERDRATRQETSTIHRVLLTPELCHRHTQALTRAIVRT